MMPSENLVTQLGSVALIYYILPSVLLIGVDFSCPPYFTDGENLVSCKINRTAIIQAECEAVQKYVTFERTGIAICRTPSLNSSNCSPVMKPVTNSCWCNGTDGEIFDYKFAYLASPSRDAGVQLECKVCFDPGKDLIRKSSESCKNISFANTASDVHTITPIIVGACVGTLLLVLVSVIVIFLFRKYHHNRLCGYANPQET
ncbi:uncharacterized protein LOC112568541 isoform X2 [Pomacea canaliculata]|uniref:uncharacterized protein LOC112568541 isoform X2 n=1 Tax=Pomacea canaliculata TaxID=400727 RepID=UPI000D734508|nr:uncharacterized protein LOC112568541 isoform X2 [Pomacea canaliculata]